MSREIKLGAFALTVILFSIWGYTFLKGNNLLEKSFTLKTYYSDVTGLSKSSPVLINGYKVGSVLNVELDPENMQQMMITFDVKAGFSIPKSARAELINESFIGGKVLSLAFDTPCSGANCVVDGDILTGKVKGLIGSMVNKGEVSEYASAIGSELSTVLGQLGTENGEGAVNKTILELQKTMENMAALTETTNRIMNQSAKNLKSTMENMASITSNLSQSNAQITSMLTNFNALSTDLKNANIGNTITTTTATLEEAKSAIAQLEGTLTSADSAMKQLNVIMDKANTGDGTMAKLLNDKDLYVNLEETTKNLSLLLQDFRLNPSRYVKVSVFGGKNKDPYTVPEEDPAFKKD